MRCCLYGVTDLKRRFVTLLSVLIAVLLCACGQTRPADDGTVDIYLPVQDTEGVGAQAYVQALQEENPDMRYTYYNDGYYIQTVTESERQAMVDYLTGSENPFAAVIAASEQYGDVFIDAEVSGDGAAVVFTVDRDAYMLDSVGAAYYAWYLGSAYGERLQAYELVPLDERGVSVSCVDENGDVLMQSDGPEGE